MFKMKYLINRMYYNMLSQQVRLFDGRGVCFIFKVKGSNFMSGVMCGQQW
jgi:hypothetical protein